MNKVKKIILIVISLFVFALPGNAFSADESVLFTSVPPDALIVLDLSGSMNWNPAGGTQVYGVSSCAPNPTACTGAGCTGGYCGTSRAGCNTNCSRLNIAKRAVFGMLDDTNDGTIRSTGTNTDDNSLNIRIGYMSFCDGNDTAGDYNSGNIRLRRPIGTLYSTIFCGSGTSCTTASIADNITCTNRVDNTQADSGTPLSSSLIEAKSYLDFHKGTDGLAAACRDKYVILISDGADTYICGGTGGEDVNDMYRRRRETVARAKALGDAGYKVFVIGFGAGMPLALRNNLNWAAYYGGTDNPLTANSGSTTGYNIVRCPCPAPPLPCPPCVTDLFPAGVASCQTDSPVPTTIINNIAGKSGGVGDTVANANDPATANLSGYAFIAGDANELTVALRQAVNMIRAETYSFTIASIATARITDENHLYEASFEPIEDEPFWRGHLRKYTINPNGTIGSEVWNAGSLLEARSAASRNMQTLIGGTLTNFTTAIAPANLGVGTTARRDEIVGYIRGEPASNQDFWKLGDIWHSSPVVIGSPNRNFTDVLDSNNAFAAFRTANERTSAIGNRIVIAGANDGQLHVFSTSSGAETYSFIPPNMLPKLQLIDHLTHPTLKTHQFFVDGPISAADVWLGSGSGASKSAGDWRTIAVVSLGRGVNDYSGSTVLRPYLWSANSGCTPNTALANNGYSATYTADTPNYCGYYAFDFTNTSSPLYRWRLNPSGSDPLYLGDPWSKMAIGRVRIGGNERWVGFIGGGGYEYSCSNPLPNPANIGKGFFVVDLSNGNILWSHRPTTFAIPAPPAIIDTDNDGFIDTVYVGDLGGNMWRFKFCTDKQGNSCGTSNWSGNLLYNAGTGRPVYTAASVAIDTKENPWVYWGTGDKQCPALTNVSEHFYALKDHDRTATYTVSNLVNLTGSAVFTGTAQGWRIALPGTGEKVLSESLIYDDTIYFTTFTPSSGADPCKPGGDGKLYGVHYITAAAALLQGANVLKSIDLGVGIPSAPRLSINPEGTAADIYVTVSGGGGIPRRTSKIDVDTQPPRSNIIYWRDRRVQ